MAIEKAGEFSGDLPGLYTVRIFEEIRPGKNNYIRKKGATYCHLEEGSYLLAGTLYCGIAEWSSSPVPSSLMTACDLYSHFNISINFNI